MYSNISHKEIRKLRGMENFRDYVIDTMGNVYSLKYKKVRKLKQFWTNPKNNPYMKVFLRDCNGNDRAFYVHILMKLAFMPEEVWDKKITHINGIGSDNRLENLAIAGTKKKYGEVRTYELGDDVLKEIELVHKASLEKGLHQKDSFSFINEIITELLDEYCNRKGLKKIMHRLRMEQNSCDLS